MPDLKRWWKRIGIIASIPFVKSQYGIKRGYRCRSSETFFDDRENTDHYQKEVYLKAHEIMLREGYTSVLDYGCGSGYKLVQYLGEFDGLGIDTGETVHWLREQYPDRDWADYRDIDGSNIKAQLVICADVIEHVLDPTQLIYQILAMPTVEKVVFSTPDRDIIRGTQNYGPPLNPYHVREWNMPEWRTFMSRYFHIEEHVIANYEQGTQMMICCPKARKLSP